MVADTTKNTGAGASVESVTRFLLSVNSTLDAADVTLAERPVPALASNGSHAATTPVTNPARHHRGGLLPAGAGGCGCRQRGSHRDQQSQNCAGACRPRSRRGEPRRSGVGDRRRIDERDRHREEPGWCSRERIVGRALLVVEHHARRIGPRRWDRAASHPSRQASAAAGRPRSWFRPELLPARTT